MPFELLRGLQLGSLDDDFPVLILDEHNHAADLYFQFLSDIFG